jgi:hypothetical protein
MWVLIPYNNYVLENAYIADSYLPPAAVMMVLVLVFGVNPLLRRFRPAWALGFREQAVVFAVLLVATTVTASGLLRMLPYGLVGDVMTQREDAGWRQRYEAIDIPSSLYPAPLRQTTGLEAAEHFQRELPEGAAIPWGAWLGPAVSWSAGMLPWWVFSVGLAGVTLVQWRERERLLFPLAEVQRGLLDREEGGFSTLFRSRRFWWAAGAVFAVYLIRGLHLNFPGHVPPIPLEWNLSPVFALDPWRHLPSFFKSNRIYFMFVAFAYFMPLRASFSIWFVLLVDGIILMLGNAYGPGFHGGVFWDQRAGAMLAVTAFVLWFGRAHWLRVARCIAARVEGIPAPRRTAYAVPAITGLTLAAALPLAFGARPAWAAIGLTLGLSLGTLCLPLGDDAARRDRLYGVMTVAGAAGYVGWLVWAGMGFWPAVLVFAIGFVHYVVIARVVAETGVPFFGLSNVHYGVYYSLFPVTTFTPTGAWLAGGQAEFIGDASRVSATAMASNALAIDRSAPPPRQARLGLLFVAVILVSFLACGAVHLALNYSHRTGVFATTAWQVGGSPVVVGAPINSWGLNRMQPARAALENRLNGSWDVPSQYDRPRQVALGAGIAAALQWACLRWPRWPVHPVGLIFAFSWYSTHVGYSFFFGWLLRRLITGVGGSRLYSMGRPFFLGVILGEVFALVFWFVVPLFFGLAGRPLPVLQIIPY